MFVRLIAASAAAFLLSNCAIHPVPEDVTGVNTYHIARQIRCETREAALQFLLRELRRLATDHEDQLAVPIARQVLDEYEANPDSISKFTPERFRGPKYEQVRNFYRVIYSTAIAYNFDLTMTENNDLGTTINLLGPWARKFTLGVTGDVNRARTNERSFTVTDTFGDLLMTVNTPVRGRRYCDGQIVQANYVYPIAGHIGVDELVMTFFQLVYLGGLSVKDGDPGAIGPPTIADKLTFTTTIDATLTPKIIFTPVGAGFQLADASVTGSATRTDTHKVTVGLALDKEVVASLGSLRGYLFSRERSAGFSVASPPVRSARVPASRTVRTARVPPSGIFIGNTLTAQARTSAEELAANAVDQLKSRELQLIRSP
ncbi:hypothetical protein IVB18_04270 [Bradyrhizobium sp. 186]|uniref:hypothetical protein n=1 Tax=Bradyrhizobium sp. 186 TaxID=2782654 RepID=UPI002000E352|nr:hypothetical protein [Bradyrhizobium sp. 186]UPK36605.1 hypothetical protein IVB18_04270 [Bradyrhizobium sp. 186]